MNIDFEYLKIQFHQFCIIYMMLMWTSLYFFYLGQYFLMHIDNENGILLTIIVVYYAFGITKKKFIF